MDSKLIYIALAVLLVGSLTAYSLLPVGAQRDLVAAPAIGSLFLALFQIFRDMAAHEKAVGLLELQNNFALGAMSHLANVAFDKHVSFCEKYAEEMSRLSYDSIPIWTG